MSIASRGLSATAASPPHTVWRHPSGIPPFHQPTPLAIVWRRLCHAWIRLRRISAWH